jgi:PAS domain S-box-containing protein
MRDYLHHLVLEERDIEDVILATMEAATNAIRHSGCSDNIGIVLRVVADEIVASVTDHGHGFDPSLFRTDEPPDVYELGGRGLFLIGKLMDHVELRFEGGTEVRMRKHSAAVMDDPSLSFAIDPLVESGRQGLNGRLVEMLENLDDAFVALDWEWRYLYVNEAAEQQLGLPRERLLGRSIFALFPPLVGSEFDRQYRLAMEQGRVAYFEAHYETWDKWFEERVYPSPFGISMYSREVTERKRVEQERRDLLDGIITERAQLAAVLENMTEGVVIVDAQAKALRMNVEALRLTGSPPPGDSGHSPDLWRQYDLRDVEGIPIHAEDSPFARAARGERFTDRELEMRRPDGDQRRILTCSGVPILDDEGEVVLAVITMRDVTSSKQEEERDALRTVIAEGVSLIHEAALVSRDEETLGKACLRVAEEMTDSKFGFIREFGDDGLLHQVALSGPGWTASAMADVTDQWESRAFPVDGIHGTVVREARPVYSNDLRQHADGNGFPDGHPPVTSFLGVPLLQEGRCVGLIAVADREGGYGEEQLEALEGIAPAVVLAFSRKRAQVALQESLARTRVLGAIAAASAAGERIDQVSEAVLTAAALHLDLKAGSVNYLDGERRELYRSATFGAAYADPAFKEPIPFDESHNIGRMLIRGLPYLTHESPEQADLSLQRFEEMGLAGDAWIKVPIGAQDGLCGALTLVFSGRRSFSPEDISFYRAIADQLGVALQRTRLAEEREGQRRALGRAAELSFALDAINDVVRGVGEPRASILDAARLAADALQAQTATIHLLYGDAWEVFEPGRQRHLPAVRREQELRCAELVRETKAVAATCDCGPEDDALVGARARLGAPLVSGGTLLGAVLFEGKQCRAFGPDEMDFAGKAGAALGGSLENMQLYDALSKQLELSTLLLRASKALTGWMHPDDMLERLAEVLLQAVPGSGAAIFLLDAETQESRVVISAGLSPFAAGKRSDPDWLPASLREQSRSHASAVIRDPDAWQAIVADGGSGPGLALSVPLAAQGRVFGFCIITSGEGRDAFSDVEVKAVESIADQASVALENARLFSAEVEARRAASRELDISQALVNMARSFASEMELPRLLETVAQTVMQGLGDVRVDISLKTGEEQWMVTASAGAGSFTVGSVFRTGDMSRPAREAVHRGRLVLVDYDALPNGDVGDFQGARPRTGIVVPLVTKARAIGIMGIDTLHHRQEFSERDISLAQGIADQAAIAIENAQLFENEREQVMFGEALDEAGRLLHSTLDDDTILGRALEAGGRALKADSGVISMRERSRWVVRSQYGFKRDLTGSAWTDEEVPFMADARRDRAPVVIDDIALASREVAGTSPPPGVRSVLTVPLAAGEEIVGSIVYNKPDANAFRDTEIAFAMRLARSVSLALQNARLFAHEHGIAETLQEALLAMPEAIPGFTIAHEYHSATIAARVGGDFYDVFELAHGIVGVLVGDISGKGLDAAVLTSVVKNAVRAQALERSKSPAEVLHILNEVMLRSSAAETFASVFFGVFDGRDGRLLYCNAGHTAGMVRRRNGRVDQLPYTSPVVGAFPDMRFRCAETRLEDDEVLFLYTDGLIEARKHGQLFGESRVLELLASFDDSRPDDMVRRVASEVMAFADGRLSDDMALLAITCQGGAQVARQQKWQI